MSSKKASAKSTSDTHKCGATMILIIRGHGYPTQIFSEPAMTDPYEAKADGIAVSAHDHIRETAAKAYAKLLERLPKQ